MIKLEKFNEKDYEIIYVLTDIHGTFEPFEKFWKNIKENDLNKKILIIITGDSCDRGLKSKELYDLYKEINLFTNIKLIHLLGNHEQMLLNSIKNQLELNLWLSNGGTSTIYSFDDKYKNKYKNFQKASKKIYEQILKEQYNFKEKFSEYYKYIESFPHILESEHFIFVHAGINFNLSLEMQIPEEVLWRRDMWQKRNKSEKKIFYGHTPSPEVIVEQNCCNLDTGVCFGYKLSIAKIEKNKISLLEISNENNKDLNKKVNEEI